MITEHEYRELREKIEKHSRWVDTIRDKNGWASYTVENIPEDVPNPTNEERTLVEIYEFMRDKPERYFVYVDEQKQEVTTWTGFTIGKCTLGPVYKVPAFGGFPSKRQSIRFKAINGCEYYGTYYTSSGNYARVKRVKS